MWELTTPWYELVIRAASFFIFVFVVCRIWGKKHLGQMAAFDLLLLLILSEAVQNALVDDDKSITGGFIVIATLVLLNMGFNQLSFRFRSMEKLLDGVPQVVIHEGKVIEKNIQKLTLSEDELKAALRKEGVLDYREVKVAMMETDGKISVVKRQESSEVH